MTTRSYKVTALAIPTALLASAASACGPSEDWGMPPVAPEGPPPQTQTVQTVPQPGDTPSTAVYEWSQVPPTQTLTVPSVGEASARWTLPPANPWSPYQKATLLMTLDADERAGTLPDVSQLEVVTSAQRAASAVAAAGLPEGTMWLVDLRGPASVAFGATLSRESREPVSPVMTFNNWPADNESVPAEETLAALCTMQPRPPVGRGPSVPVFMLDAWRLAYRYDHPDDETTDNRYMLTASDLPDGATLRARGIDRVLYVVESLEGVQVEEDDLHQTFLDYQAMGITTSIVDLAQLNGLAAQRPETPYYGQALYVDSGRVTVIGDPSFYHRARGGFGGTHVVYGGGHPFFAAYGFTLGTHGGG
jgi:hypothetical protein